MLRLTLKSQTAARVVLQVDGWLVGDWVEILAAEGRRCLGQSQRLVLELDGVQSIDEAGLKLLEGWSGGGLVLRGGSELLWLVLQKRGLI